jgi:hypothetical protein
MKRIYLMLTMLVLVAGCASTPKFTVLTDPAGADIFVDGERVAKTPATIKVSFPENSQMVKEKKILTVKLPGYKEMKEVICDDGVPEKKFTLMLMPEPGEKSTEVDDKASGNTTQSAKAEAAVVSKQSATSEHASK